MHRLRRVFVIILTFATGCIPYAVGSTARTVPADEHTSSGTMFIVPNGIESRDRVEALTIPGFDAEFRTGIDDHSDYGIRIPSSSGVIINYKNRLGTVPDASIDTGAAVAVMVGAGLINFGQHAHFELSLIGSSREDRTAVLYGGLRVMQVAPLSRSVPSDRPTAGGFLGWRIGSTQRGISPEIGVFYDHSALGIRRGDLVVVPSITFHGSVF